MRAVIHRFDAYLSRAHQIFQFCQAEDCLLRLQISKAPHRAQFSGLTVEAGEPVLAIHLWNEHLPRLAPKGSDLAWAAHTGRLWVKSLHAAAGYLREHPDLASLRAIYGATALFSPFDRSGGVALMQRLGFTVLPYHGPLGRFGEFWENFYSWWVIWAYNPASLRLRRWMDLRRSEIWMGSDEFLRRYGAISKPKASPGAGPV